MMFYVYFIVGTEAETNKHTDRLNREYFKLRSLKGLNIKAFYLSFTFKT